LQLNLVSVSLFFLYEEKIKRSGSLNLILFFSGVPCRNCYHCKIGRYNLCRDVQFLATPPIDGSLATFHVHDADFCHKMPDNVSIEEGALIEPLSVGVHAMTRAGVSAGSTVLIMGAGPIGLVCLLSARACGASFIIVTDVRSERLVIANQLGAKVTLLATDKLLQDLLDLNHQIDVCVECSGAEQAIKTGIRSIRAGGKMVLIGRGTKPELSIPLYYAADQEIDLIGVFRYANVYPKALSLVASGQINVKPLITHRFNLEQCTNAFELAESGADGAIKVMFTL